MKPSILILLPLFPLYLLSTLSLEQELATIKPVINDLTIGLEQTTQESRTVLSTLRRRVESQNTLLVKNEAEIEQLTRENKQLTWVSISTSFITAALVCERISRYFLKD